MKKVLIIIPSLGIGGLERMAVNIANAIADMGHEVTVMNLAYHDVSMRELFHDSVNYLQRSNPQKSFLHATNEDIKNHRVRLLPNEVWFYFHSPQYIHKVYIHKHYDVEIAFYYGLPAQIVCGAPSNTKKVFWVHEIPSAIRQKDLNLIRMWKENKSIRRMDTAVCVSSEFENEVRDKYGCKEVITIPNLSDYYSIIEKANETVTDVKKDRFTFIFVGRIDIEHKGIDRLLEAAESLASKGEQFDIWIVGDGEDAESVKAIIAGKQLTFVYMLGKKSNPYPYIAMADALVLSSRWEAYGLVMAESMILKTPVIATDCDGSREILDHGKYGFLVDNSVEGIASGMEKIMDEKAYTEVLAQTMERRESLKPDTVLKQIKEVLM